MAILSLIIIGLIIWILLDNYLGYKHHIAKQPLDLNHPKQSNIHLFTDGHRFFKQLMDDLKTANHHIHMSFFIFREDTLGTEMIKLLQDKASSGVKVRLLVDFLGSFGLKQKTLRDFKKHGIEFAYATKPRFPYLFFSLNRRNHRKITIVDGHVGYFGGFNVGDEYLGKKAELGFWQDYHLRLTGRGVHDLQRCFLHDWISADNHINDNKEQLYPSLGKGKHKIELIPTNGYGLEELFIKHIDKATQHIFIGSPYFIPSQKLLNSLMNALERGVDITIMLPFKKDHPFVKPASYTYIKPLIEKGCRFYHYYQGFYHAKVFTIDQHVCHIGTANFDKRSLFLNDEINGFIYDQEIINKVRGMTEEDIHRSIEISLNDVVKRSVVQKGKTAMSTWLSPLL